MAGIARKLVESSIEGCGGPNPPSCHKKKWRKAEFPNDWNKRCRFRFRELKNQEYGHTKWYIGRLIGQDIKDKYIITSSSNELSGMEFPPECEVNY